jgi:hypothetical protein
MGGVDLADQRRLHSNSTVMGQHRWWLKLFFYLLDVGTANSVILYNKFLESDGKAPTNIKEFKEKLVMSFCGARIAEIPRPVQFIHQPEAAQRRHKCVYCTINGELSRTRYKCCIPGCALPLCSVANGKSLDDCFTLVHASEDLRKACLKKHLAMQKKTGKDKK